eukprot:7388387-Prymnesium_polylepis.1
MLVDHEDKVRIDMADAFVWDGRGALMHWSRPAAAALLYFICCAVHNATLTSSTSTARLPRLVDRVGVMHNLVLTLFSVVVFCNSTALFVAELRRAGLRAFLCAPVEVPGVSMPAPLGGALHYWCYIYYVSKYYELVDTLLLMLRRKRIIALHALHHGLIPLVMCVLFDGRVSVSLVSLSVVNSFVHIVMYAYFLTTALGRKPPDAMRKQITRLQIVQFSTGVFGGGYYWCCYFDGLRPIREWPFVTYAVGWCAPRLCVFCRALRASPVCRRAYPSVTLMPAARSRRHAVPAASR